MNMETKKCFRCKKEKFVSEFHYDHRYNKPMSWCKECETEYGRSQSQKEYTKAYNEKRRKMPKVIAYMKEYFKKPEFKAYHKQYAKIYNQTQKSKKLKEDWRNSEFGKSYMEAYLKRWMKTEKGVALRARAKHKRRALERDLPCDLTSEQWEEIMVSQNNKCNICGETKPLERDHIIPVTRGGAFTKRNIQGLCRSCNAKKNNKIINFNGKEN